MVSLTVPVKAWSAEDFGAGAFLPACAMAMEATNSAAVVRERIRDRKLIQVSWIAAEIKYIRCCFVPFRAPWRGKVSTLRADRAAARAARGSPAAGSVYIWGVWRGARSS